MKPFLGFFGPFLPKILFSFAEILTRGGLQLVFGKTVFEKYFKILNLTQMEDTESLQFCSILGPNLLLENQKYC